MQNKTLFLILFIKILDTLGTYLIYNTFFLVYLLEINCIGKHFKSLQCG